MTESDTRPIRTILQELVDAMRKEAAATSNAPGRRLSAEEAALWEIINRTLPPAAMKRYESLRGKLGDETLSPLEHEELLKLSDEIEVLHADRLNAVIELAAMQGVAVRDLENSIGIAAA